MKTLITTIPKSGTYLARELLVRAGWECDDRHIRQRAKFDGEIRGDFRVGHLGYRPLLGLRIVFIHRDLRDVFISSLRYSMQIGKRREEPITPEYLLRKLKTGRLMLKNTRLLDWKLHADVVLTFDDLHTEKGVMRLVGCGKIEARQLLYWNAEVDKAWKLTYLHSYNKLLGHE